jgi:choline dehydrogenase-like flavoprotein
MPEHDVADVADVLIVGGGTSGGVAAKHLAMQGLSVVVLEQGHWTNPSDMPGDKPEYELVGGKQWNPDPNVRGKVEDYPIDCSDSSIPLYMYNGVGGTSVLFAACWSRALPSDFRVRTLDGVADDWPISYEELEPYYDAVDVEMGVSGLGGNPAYPPGQAPPLPPHPILSTGRKMAEAMNELGWHWWPGYNAIPSQDYRHQKQCQRLGICHMGCPEGAKASTDITQFPDAIKHGALVVTGARVAEVTLDENGLANGARYIKDGQEYFQPAARVIVAANGIGTPRLLLMSKSERFPDGLANSSGLVGKRLMIHPYGATVGLYDDDLDDLMGPTGEQIESMQFYETDKSRGFVRGCKWILQPATGPLRTIGRWTAGEGVCDEPFWGESFTTKMKQSMGHMIQWLCMVDDLPEETNRVTLHPEWTDSDGLPAVKVEYATHENTVKMLDFNLARTLEAHEAAGASRAWITSRTVTPGHNLGTAKMGDDPATSVVNRWCQTHDVENLYIIDGSVFTTSTGVNPTATICALAKRTATYIAEKARGEGVPTTQTQEVNVYEHQ